VIGAGILCKTGIALTKDIKREIIMKKCSITKCLIAMFFIFCFYPAAASLAAEKVITLKMASFVPATTLEGKTMQAWADEVAKRTNGRVKVNIYPGGTLMPPAQTYDGITKEVADIGYGIFAYHRGRFPLTEVIDLPLGYNNPAVPSKLINAYYQKFKPKELSDVKVLFLEAHGCDLISTIKPITKLSDLRGMKIRASGLSSKIVNAIGGSAVGLPITDTYDAMSKGVIEGLVLDWGGLLSWRFGELVKNHIVSPGVASTVAFYTVMNKDKWNKLPQDIQTIIDKLDEEWIARVSQKWADWENMGKTELLKKGGKIITLSKQDSAQWVEKMKPILDDYVKVTKKKGLPGDQALKFCQDYLKANDK
jgi:TRAP-type C4-dicarboxylate transport system substrate-binding protein